MFLNDVLVEEAYKQQPPRYEQYGASGEVLMCRLTKVLYGLHQAPRAWFDKLKMFILSLNFVLSEFDASLFVRISTTCIYVLFMWMILLSPEILQQRLMCLSNSCMLNFLLKTWEICNIFLDIEVSRSADGSLHLCQRKYVLNLLDRCGMFDTKSVNTPMISHPMLSKFDGTAVLDPTKYRSIAGALQYVVLTRPYIAYAVNHICQFMHAPTDVRVVALKRILRYLRETVNYGLVFRPSARLSLVGYADANWSLDLDDRRSTTGYCIYFGGNSVS